MSHPSHWARVAPDRVAIRMAGSGEEVTYAELDARSNRVAHLLRRHGLTTGAGIAILMENHVRFLEICWGAQRSGLFFTPVSTRLKPDELAYVLENSGAKALFTTPKLAGLAREAAAVPGAPVVFIVGGEAEGFIPYEPAVAELPDTPIADQSPGRDMLYSSGTTGRPKGVKIDLGGGDLGTIPPAMGALTRLYGFGEDTVNLTTAPLYHAGPLRYSICLGHTGGTNIIMESFSPQGMLELIQRWRVTHVEVVPTMFVRLLKLSEAERGAYDISSLRRMIHGSGPCAPQIKREMIEWLGPMLEEQYGGTEGNGLTIINSEEWLARPGSVGKSVLGIIRIVGEDGREVPVGETGLVYFENGAPFAYHGDPEKTAKAYSPEGWSTLGDIGHLDAEGYLYLTDRQSHMIISGGVNIYPQEIENVLIVHPQVLDVAVIGVPDPEFGEAVKAVVHPRDPVGAGPELAAELIAYCRSQISTIKTPRSVDFVTDLPRHDTGKIYKRLLRDRYLPGGDLA